MSIEALENAIHRVLNLVWYYTRETDVSLRFIQKDFQLGNDRELYISRNAGYFSLFFQI